RCLVVGGKPLWDDHDSGENLLFKASDFRAPASSRLLPRLLQLPDPDVLALVGHLIDASLRPPHLVPLLCDLVAGDRVVSLSGKQTDPFQPFFPAARLARPIPPTPAGVGSKSPTRVQPPLLSGQGPRRRSIRLSSYGAVSLGVAAALPLLALLLWLKWP